MALILAYVSRRSMGHVPITLVGCSHSEVWLLNVHVKASGKGKVRRRRSELLWIERLKTTSLMRMRNTMYISQER
jgi:hypothetical protein